MPSIRTILKWTGIGLVALVILMQFVPYGRDHDNPAAGQPIAWDSPRTQELMEGACMDCHSNETEWPWYSNIAPMSWLVQRDVDEGRDALNLSAGTGEIDEMVETVQDGSMPPWFYKPLHSGARLSETEKQELIAGIQATFGAEGGEDEER
jgi:mono/diheme cytochrome c family protein